ncbi:MAG: type 4b pilus protein PilO2 [Desulfovibrio sp.]|jgi:hypothetical protein|nr:type 4b pilus protein PilO2 [Desulfovibrio sp.]
MRMVMINNLPWAVGMHWETSPMRRLSRKKLRELAIEKLGNEYDMAAFRPRQHAFGVSGGNPEKFERVRSLAACLDVYSFLGIFMFMDADGNPFWWVFGRQNGLTVGMGDQVFTARDDAVSELNSLRELLDMQEQEIVRCETMEESLAHLASLLMPVNLQALLFRTGMLMPLNITITRRKKRLFLICVSTGITVACIFGINALLENRAHEASVASARLSRLNKEQRDAEVRAHPERYFEQSWMDAPLADAVASQCLPAIIKTPLYSNGWQLDSITCVGGVLSIAWRHQSGADFVRLPAQATLKDARNAVSRHTLDAPQGQRLIRSWQEYPHILTRDYAARQLYQLCQDTGTKLKLTFATPEKSTIADLGIDVIAPWRKGSWELQDIHPSLMGDMAIMQALSRLPGLTLETIHVKDDRWTIKGAIYVK